MPECVPHVATVTLKCHIKLWYVTFPSQNIKKNDLTNVMNCVSTYTIKLPNVSNVKTHLNYKVYPANNRSIHQGNVPLHLFWSTFANSVDWIIGLVNQNASWAFLGSYYTILKGLKSCSNAKSWINVNIPHPRLIKTLICHVSHEKRCGCFKHSSCHPIMTKNFTINYKTMTKHHDYH